MLFFVLKFKVLYASKLNTQTVRCAWEEYPYVLYFFPTPKEGKLSVFKL